MAVFNCEVCGGRITNRPEAELSEDRLAGVQLFRHLIDEHELSIDDAYWACQRAIYPEEHGVASTHTHTHETSGDDEWHDDDRVVLTKAALELN